MWFRSKSRTAAPATESVDLAGVAAALLDAIRAAGITGEPRIDGTTLFIEESGVTRHVNLGNLAREYGATPPDARPALLAKYVRLAERPVGMTSPDLRSRLLPKLTPRREREAVRAAALTGIVARPFDDGALLLELAVDEPECIRGVSTGDLEKYRLPEDEAYAHALSNLRERSGGAWKELVPGLFLSPWNDYFDGARLALPSLIRGLAIKGAPVAVIPNRRALLVTGTDEPAGLAALPALTATLVGEDRPVHVAPLILRDDRWEPWVTRASRDAGGLTLPIYCMASRQHALDLESCGGLVRAILIGKGFTDVAAAKLHEDGSVVVTLAHCPAGERIAVPETHFVAFGEAVVAWRKLAALLGDDLVPLDVWPPHYELRRIPTAAELAFLDLNPRN